MKFSSILIVYDFINDSNVRINLIDFSYYEQCPDSKEYLFASYEQRLWILRGLLDTDGSASKSYCSYATISEQLADDVVELVHSLGGYASKNRRKAGYKKNGEYIRCNDYFEIIIEFQKGK